jgi:hypothetical protein
MKQTQQIVFGLLALSVLAILLVAGGYAFHRLTYHPPLFTPSAEMKNHSNVKMVREATNLEGLKRVCELWAETEDQSRLVLNMQIQTFDRVLKSTAIGLGLFGVIFTVGLACVYMQLRRLQRVTPNAF